MRTGFCWVTRIFGATKSDLGLSSLALGCSHRFSTVCNGKIELKYLSNMQTECKHCTVSTNDNVNVKSYQTRFDSRQIDVVISENIRHQSIVNQNVASSTIMLIIWLRIAAFVYYSAAVGCVRLSCVHCIKGFHKSINLSPECIYEKQTTIATIA